MSEFPEEMTIREKLAVYGWEIYSPETGRLFAGEGLGQLIKSS
jgi:hypothetical protein